MYQLRIYTLRAPETLEDYATACWPRHIHSLRAFDVTTHGIWTDHDASAHRLTALISFAGRADPAAVTAADMASPEFTADMKAFDAGNIIKVRGTPPRHGRRLTAFLNSPPARARGLIRAAAGGRSPSRHDPDHRILARQQTSQCSPKKS